MMQQLLHFAAFFESGAEGPRSKNQQNGGKFKHDKYRRRRYLSCCNIWAGEAGPDVARRIRGQLRCPRILLRAQFGRRPNCARAGSEPPDGGSDPAPSEARPPRWGAELRSGRTGRPAACSARNTRGPFGPLVLLRSASRCSALAPKGPVLRSAKRCSHDGPSPFRGSAHRAPF